MGFIATQIIGHSGMTATQDGFDGNQLAKRRAATLLVAAVK